MTTAPPATPPATPADGAPSASLARLLRERDNLFVLHEALGDVERARSFDERRRVLEQAIRRIGFGRVETVSGYTMPAGASLVAQISNSSFLDTNDLIVPLRAAGGTAIAMLVLGDRAEPGVPTLARVRTVELFAQQVASTIDNARLYDESLRERGRGEALADIARAVSGSLRLTDVLQLSLRHAVALLHTQGATLGLLRDDQIVIVAGIGVGEGLIGAPVPVNASVSGHAILERRTVICNDASIEAAYGPSRIAANVERTLVAPLFSSTGAIGVLAVINRESEFLEDDALVLQRLADQVAVAVANARLYEDAQAAADRYRRASEDERRARDAVERSESRYTRLVEAASDAIFTIDRDGAMTAVNRSLERSSGKARAALLGATFDALIDPRDQPSVARAIHNALDGHRQRVELRYQSAEGETRQCSLTLTPLLEGDAVGGALGIVRDITDEKRLTDQLIQQEKLAAVGQLVSGVAHELNNPLASVMAFAQLLIAAPPGTHDHGAIEAINQEARRAAKIVSNLLTFARQHQPERTAADLNRVVEDTIELRRYALRMAQIEVTLRLDPSLPVTWADPFQLQQVVLNLMTNAEQAMSAASVPSGSRRLSVATGRSGGTLWVRVADNGPGISPENVPRIFNPFFTTKPVGEGTGLGLSISDGIVREHGGRIRVESRPGDGAAFVIELPYAQPPAPEAPHIGIAEPPVASRRRLLVVDDEPTIRAAITSYFRSLGHSVDVAATGSDAIGRATAARYDGMVLDLRLPDQSGDDVLRELEQRGVAPQNIVFITGDTRSEAAQRVLAATGRPTISKPFALDDLAAAVLAAPAG